MDTVQDAPEIAGALAALQARDIAIDIGTGDPAPFAIVFVGRIDDDVLARVHELAAGCERVLAAVAAPSGAGAAKLLAAGAADVIALHGRDTIAAIAARFTRWHAIDELLEARVVRDNLVGSSRTWRALLRRIVEIARFTQATVLLAGESGTGKELAARLVHTLDARPDKGELVVVDCTTIVPTLSGSEFFGHERGAFTGAAAARDGAFALAHRGTLFLDEVGDLPLALQAQLLRVIQEHTYKRVGGNDWQRSEFRLVCASHRDLAAAVARGEFRHDLYHRIATWTFELPSLARRRDDIPALVRHFTGGRVELDADVEHYLVHREYPGNIRELRHAVQRLIDRHPGEGPITLGQIPEHERGALADAWTWPDAQLERAIRTALGCGIGLKAVRKATEDLTVQLALELDGGNIARASRRLGVTERALQMRQAARRDSDDALTE